MPIPPEAARPATPEVDESVLLATLERYWGYREFRPLQREAIAANLQGRDSVVVLPTGGGKSLCFQMPALVGPGGGVGLVVSPLISLMKDQVDGLVASGVTAGALNASITPDERRRVYADLDEGRCRLLYVTPERLVGEGGEGFRARLRTWGVRFVAVDEAHCISQWGHEFRPEYRQLAQVRDDFPGAALHAFTATATRRVREDIVSQLALRSPEVLVGSFDRPNLVYRVRTRTGLKDQIRKVLDRHAGEAGIVYCLSRREVESLAEWLEEQGHRARPYHAGLADETRRRHQEEFLQEGVDVMVATVAFGMGIDRSNIRFVIHAGAPRSLEHYQQESGRAGRDGLEAECILFYSGADFARWRQMLEQSGELTDTARRLLTGMSRYAAGTRCRHRTLVEYFDQPYERDACGACDWCLKELERVDDERVLCQKILSGGGPPRAAVGRGPRHRRAAGTRHRRRRPGAPPGAEHVRPPRRCPHRRAARLSRPAHRAGAAAAHGGALSGAPAHRPRGGGPEGPRPRSSSTASRGRRRASASAGPRTTPPPGKASIATCSKPCGSAASRSPGPAASRPTWSSTTTRCATSPGAGRPRRTSCCRSTASAPGRPRTSDPSCST